MAWNEDGLGTRWVFVGRIKLCWVRNEFVFFSHLGCFLGWVTFL